MEQRTFRGQAKCYRNRICSFTCLGAMYTVCQLVSGGTYPLLLRELKHLFLQSLTFLVFLLVVFCSHVQPHLQVLHLSLQLC